MKKLTLALDIGNVCIAINPANAVASLAPAEIPLFQQTELQMERGEITPEQFFSRCRELRHDLPSLEECKAVFNSILVAPVPGMNELVASFPARGIHAVFFSDISLPHLIRSREIFAAASCVPEGVYSFEAGALKPSEIMLNAFERRFGRPDLYVDDRQELVDAACRYGWNAVRFTGAADLEKIFNEIQK